MKMGNKYVFIWAFIVITCSNDYGIHCRWSRICWGIRSPDRSSAQFCADTSANYAVLPVTQRTPVSIARRTPVVTVHRWLCFWKRLVTTQPARETASASITKCFACPLSTIHAADRTMKLWNLASLLTFSIHLLSQSRLAWWTDSFCQFSFSNTQNCCALWRFPLVVSELFCVNCGRRNNYLL